jgi:hypothetical protein
MSSEAKVISSYIPNDSLLYLFSSRASKTAYNVRSLLVKYRIIMLVTILTLVVSGCSSQAPEPTPDIASTVAAAVAATQTAQPTNTPIPEPTDTPTPEPSPTPEPTSTPEPLPTDTPAPVSVLESTVLESGWTRYESSDGFAISLPPQWQPLNLNAVALGNALEAVSEDVPEFEQFFSNQFMRNLVASGIKFYALDLSPESVSYQIPSSINILKTDLGIEFPLDPYVALNIRQIQEFADPAVPIINERVTLGEAGPEAEMLQYQMNLPGISGELSPAVLLQYLIVDKSLVYVITLSAPPELLEAKLETMKQIAQTFEQLP